MLFKLFRQGVEEPIEVDADFEHHPYFEADGEDAAILGKITEGSRTGGNGGLQQPTEKLALPSDNDDNVVGVNRQSADVALATRLSAVPDAVGAEYRDVDDVDAVLIDGSSSNKRRVSVSDNIDEDGLMPKSRKLSMKKCLALRGSGEKNDENPRYPEDDGLINDCGVKATDSDEGDVIGTEAVLFTAGDIEGQSDHAEEVAKEPKRSFQEHNVPKKNFIEEAVEDLKSLRRQPKKEVDYVKVEQECIEFLERMVSARDDDVHTYKNGMPALSKLRMLKEVQEITIKVNYLEPLLDNMLLAVIKTWLDPYEDGVLVNVQTRETLLKILTDFPVDSTWLAKLQSSQGLGRVVNYLSIKDDCSRNRRMAWKLMEKWARQVFNNKAEFQDILGDLDRPSEGFLGRKDGIVSTRRAANETIKSFAKDQDFGIGEDKEQPFAQVPRPTPLLFTALPDFARKANAKIVNECKTKTNAQCRVDNVFNRLRRQNKGGPSRAAKPSVNGR